MASPPPPNASSRTLIVTLTNEVFTPVRIYYETHNRLMAASTLRSLDCIVESPDEGCLQWLFTAESRSLRFPDGYESVPPERRPIVLGRVKFLDNGGMVLETNSMRRATEGARFFGPRFGHHIVARRCRVANRFFAASEGDPRDLMATLDRDVTVIDPRVAEAELEKDLRNAKTPQDVERVYTERSERRRASGADIPMIEDFPLSPEEETPDFQHLDIALTLRYIRAYEHWQGNTGETLAMLIHRVFSKAGTSKSFIDALAHMRSMLN